MISQIAGNASPLTNEQVNEVVAQSLPAAEYAGKKVLLIVPDATRTAPIGQLFKAIHAQICDSATKLDVMIALGTHHAMSEEAICERLEITIEERRDQYAEVTFHNHEWDNPDALREVGTIPAADIAELSGGRVVSPGESGQLAGLFLTGDETREELRETRLWDHWLLLLLFCGLLTSEWVIRRGSGLP